LLELGKDKTFLKNLPVCHWAAQLEVELEVWAARKWALWMPLVLIGGSQQFAFGGNLSSFLLRRTSESRKQKAESRKQKAESRKKRAASSCFSAKSIRISSPKLSPSSQFHWAFWIGFLAKDCL